MSLHPNIEWAVIIALADFAKQLNKGCLTNGAKIDLYRQSEKDFKLVGRMATDPAVLQIVKEARDDQT